MAHHLGTSLGGLIYTGHPGHPQMPSMIPTPPSLSLAVTHTDEMFFNTQSTVLTSPWVAGSPWGRKVLILWDCGSVVPQWHVPSPAAIIGRLVGLLHLQGQIDMTLGGVAAWWPSKWTSWRRISCCQGFESVFWIYPQTSKTQFSPVLGVSMKPTSEE